MAQIISPLFLSPTGNTGSAVVRTSTVGVFASIMMDDMSNVFLGSGHQDFAIDIMYQHYGDSFYTPYSVIYDDYTVLQESASSSQEVLVRMRKLTMNGYLLAHKPHNKDQVIVNGRKFSVDTYTEDGFGEVYVYLKEFGR